MKSDTGSFAVWLQEQLTLRGWTQAIFAARADINAERVSAWLAGEIPSSRSVAIIARTLKLSAEVVYRAIEGRIMSEAAFRPIRSVEDAYADLGLVLPVAVPVIRPVDIALGTDAPALDYLYLPPRFRQPRPRRLFAVAAPDAAMTPVIAAGALVVADRDLRPLINQMVVIAAREGVVIARLVEQGARRVYRQDATGAVVRAVTREIAGVVTYSGQWHVPE